MADVRRAARVYVSLGELEQAMGIPECIKIRDARWDWDYDALILVIEGPGLPPCYPGWVPVTLESGWIETIRPYQIITQRGTQPMMSIDSILPAHACGLFEGDCRCLCACCRGVCDDQHEHTVDSQHAPAMCEQSRPIFTGEQPVYHLFTGTEAVEATEVDLSEPEVEPTEDEADEGATVTTPGTTPEPESTPAPVAPDPTVVDNRPRQSRTPRQPSA